MGKAKKEDGERYYDYYDGDEIAFSARVIRYELRNLSPSSPPSSSAPSNEWIIGDVISRRMSFPLGSPHLEDASQLATGTCGEDISELV